MQHQWPAMLLAVLAVLLLILIFFFDWNWFRHPVERYVSRKTERVFKIDDLHVSLGLTPRIRLRGVYLENSGWSKIQPMATADQVEFSVSLADIFEGRILLPRVDLTGADITMQRRADGRKNWVLSGENETKPSRLKISSLAVERSKLHFIDEGNVFDVVVEANTQEAKDATDTAAAAAVSRLVTLDRKAGFKDGSLTASYGGLNSHFKFSGKYHDAGFSGVAVTGDLLSFTESGQVFPIRGHLDAGTTKVDVDGTVADVAKISSVDVNLKISGATLANLYPFLLLPLPASPPYRIQGRLHLVGDKFSFDDLQGIIGSTDVSGKASYVRREPRPLLEANLHSKQLNFSDLGPLIGVKTKSTTASAPPTQVQTNTRQAAKVAEQESSNGRVLPDGVFPGERVLPKAGFEGERLRVIDAVIKADAARILAPDALALESMRFSLNLTDGVLHLNPLEFGFAGGKIAGVITLDGHNPVLRSQADVSFRHVMLEKLLPSSKALTQSSGLVGAVVQLQGQGNSIADIAASTSGKAQLAATGGQVSNLLDAAIGLNGGKVLRLLIGGDKQIDIRCAAMVFDFDNGQGKSNLFVIDTEQTRINGNGMIDLKNEAFDVTLSPQPKHPGLFSLRSPLRLFGTFRKADYAINKQALMLRGGGALALAALAPPLALLALIETGQGEDADCRRSLQPVDAAQKEAHKEVRKEVRKIAPHGAGKK